MNNNKDKIYDIIMVIRENKEHEETVKNKISILLKNGQNKILDEFSFSKIIQSCYCNANNIKCKYLIFRVSTNCIWNMKDRNKILKNLRKIEGFQKFKIVKLSSEFRNVLISKTYSQN